MNHLIHKWSPWAGCRTKSQFDWCWVSKIKIYPLLPTFAAEMGQSQLKVWELTNSQWVLRRKGHKKVAQGSCCSWMNCKPSIISISNPSILLVCSFSTSCRIGVSLIHSCIRACIHYVKPILINISAWVGLRFVLTVVCKNGLDSKIERFSKGMTITKDAESS